MVSSVSVKIAKTRMHEVAAVVIRRHPSPDGGSFCRSTRVLQTENPNVVNWSFNKPHMFQILIGHRYEKCGCNSPRDDSNGDTANACNGNSSHWPLSPVVWIRQDGSRRYIEPTSHHRVFINRPSHGMIFGTHGRFLSPPSIEFAFRRPICTTDLRQRSSHCVKTDWSLRRGIRTRTSSYRYPVQYVRMTFWCFIWP